MGASSQLWMIENEKTCEQFSGGEIDQDEFETTMKARGFDKDEIDGFVYECLN